MAEDWGIELTLGHSRVQNYSSGRYLVKPDRLHARAEFVARHLEFIHGVVMRHRRRSC